MKYKNNDGFETLVKLYIKFYQAKQILFNEFSY